MIGWIWPTHASLPDSQPEFHAGPVNRVSSRATPTEVTPCPVSSAAAARARSPRPACPTTALGSPASAARSTSPPPTSVTVPPDRTARVSMRWPPPRADSDAQAVRTLLEEAGVSGAEAWWSTSSVPVATSMTDTPVVAPGMSESPARVPAYPLRTGADGVGASAARPVICGPGASTGLGVGKGWTA